jgi:aminoglycoside/choline kinase family phosphotransferase
MNEPILPQDIYQFVTESCDSPDVKVFPLAGDASNRRYYRLVVKEQSFVLMRWEPFQIEKYPFLSVLNHFQKNKVHVPHVTAISPSIGCIVLEDLGDLTLERKFFENQIQENTFIFYSMAVDELIKIHFHATEDRKNPCTAFDIQFDTEKFMWEMNYGKEHLIDKLLDFHLSEKVSQELQNVFLNICSILHDQPKYISHRDYHSRNLMMKLDQLCVIDFQDARLGPVQYDLVSLVRDSYVDISDSFAQMIIQDYLDKAKPFLKNHSIEDFMHIYEIQAIQRCFKACGSFSSFLNLRDDRRYLKYIQPTIKKVIKSLGQFPEYKLFGDILIDSGSLDRKYENL